MRWYPKRTWASMWTGFWLMTKSKRRRLWVVFVLYHCIVLGSGLTWLDLHVVGRCWPDWWLIGVPILIQSRPWAWFHKQALLNFGYRWPAFTLGRMPKMAVRDSIHVMTSSLIQAMVMCLLVCQQNDLPLPLGVARPSFPCRLATERAVSPSLWRVLGRLQGISWIHWDPIPLCWLISTDQTVLRVLQRRIHKGFVDDSNLLFHSRVGFMESNLTTWVVPFSPSVYTRRWVATFLAVLFKRYYFVIFSYWLFAY